MIFSGSTGLIYNKSAFWSVLSCATMCQLMRWMNRENEIDGGWLCEWVKIGWIEGSTLFRREH